MSAFFAFVLAMFVSIVLIPPLMRTAPRWALVDVPSPRKVHEVPIPRIGGLAIVAGTLIPILLWVGPNRSVRGFLLGVAILVVFGLWDDRRALDYRFKFFGQLLAVGTAVFYGDILIRFVPFAGIDPIPMAVSWPLTVFALLGITNAINLVDGLDGLAAGTTLLSVAVIALLAYMAGDHALLTMALAMMGALVGFLRFNTYPAQVFMGDSGSQFLGYTLGVLVIVLTQQSSPVLSPAMPLLVLGLPLIDTFIVIGQRIADGRSPFRADRNHIHHKLLSIGLDHYESVVTIYMLQATLVALAFVCRFRSDLLNTAIFLGTLGVLAGTLALAERRGWRVRRPDAGNRPSALTSFARAMRRNAVLTRGPLLFAAISLPLYGCYAITSIPHMPVDGRLTVWALSLCTVAGLAYRRRQKGLLLIERLLAYVSTTAIVFYWCSARPPQVLAAMVENAYFAVLGLSLLIAYRFNRERAFQVTPTDILIILIALFLPMFTGTLLPEVHVAEVGIKTLVVFYALEFVIGALGRNTWWLRVVFAVLIAILLVRIESGAIALLRP